MYNNKCIFPSQWWLFDYSSCSCRDLDRRVELHLLLPGCCAAAERSDSSWPSVDLGLLVDVWCVCVPLCVSVRVCMHKCVCVCVCLQRRAYVALVVHTGGNKVAQAALCLLSTTTLVAAAVHVGCVSASCQRGP